MITLLIIIINIKHISTTAIKLMKDYTVTAGGYHARPFIKNITLEDGTGDKRKSTDSSNKTFFSNIKAELNSIRTDVTKLVAKDSVKPLNINKSYNVSSVSSAQKSETYNAELPIQKKLQKKTSCQSAQKSYPSVATSLHLQNTSNAKFQSKISEIQLKLSQTQSKLQQTQKKLFQAESKIYHQNKKYQQMKSQFEQQRKNQLSLRDQISMLKENTNILQRKLDSQNFQMSMLQNKYNMTNQQKQQAIANIEKLQSDIKKSSFLAEKLTSRPDPHLNEKMLERETMINQLRDTLRKVETQNNILKKRVENMESQNTTLKKNMQEMEYSRQLQIASISNNYEDKLNRIQSKSFKQLGAGFEVKINDLLDENYSLKNKINLMQSQIQQDKIQIQSLQSTVEAYEIRDSQVGKGVNEIELENLRNEVMQLKQKMDKMQSDHQFEIMKLENQIDQLKTKPSNKSNDNKSFNQILKDQIAEIENLKQKLRQKNQMITKLKR